LRGSARSIPGLNIRDVLAAVDARHPGLLERFGGHAMAAGLTLARAHLDAFSSAFEQAVAAQVSPDLLDAVMLSDGALQADEFSIHHARALRDGGPWGQGFPEPLFDGVFEVLDSRIIASRHRKLRLRAPDGGPVLDAIHFGGATSPVAACERMVYRLQPDDYRGGDAIQLVIEHRQPFIPPPDRKC